jgi:hypothetical protein
MTNQPDFVVQDRRRPVWEWSAELSPPERDELVALRAQRDDLLARVEELHVAAQAAHEREEALSAAVRELSTGSWPRRLRAARRLRRGS